MKYGDPISHIFQFQTVIAFQTEGVFVTGRNLSNFYAPEMGPN